MNLQQSRSVNQKLYALVIVEKTLASYTGKKCREKQAQMTEKKTKLPESVLLLVATVPNDELTWDDVSVTSALSELGMSFTAFRLPSTKWSTQSSASISPFQSSNVYSIASNVIHSLCCCCCSSANTNRSQPVCGVYHYHICTQMVLWAIWS